MKSAINLCLSASSRLGGRHFSSSSASNAKVGFIGLGNMGNHMAGYVQKGGNQLFVYDTNPDAVRPLVLQHDAVVATSPSDLASKVDRLITMVPTPKDVLEVYLGKEGVISGGQAKAGTILVDSSTIDPTTAQRVAKEAAKSGLHFVDAPVTGAVPGARAGTLTFLVGGPEETVTAVKELLMTMGKNVIHCGPVGTGQVAKICNNMLLSVVLVGTSETLNLGERLGLDPKLLTQILNISSGRSWVTESYNPVPGVGEPSLPASNDYTGGFGCKLMAKDLTLAQTIAVQSQSPIPMGSLAAQVYRLMTNNGFADKDMSYAYQFFKQNDQV